jgi:hypothetical protein
VACLGFRVFGVESSPSCAGAFFIVRSLQAVTVKGRFGRALQSWRSAPVRLDGTAGTKVVEVQEFGIAIADLGMTVARSMPVHTPHSHTRTGNRAHSMHY